MQKEPPQQAAAQTPRDAPAWQPARRIRKGSGGGTSPQVEKALAEVRSKIYPRSVQGNFARIRVLMVFLTQLAMVPKNTMA